MLTATQSAYNHEERASARVSVVLTLACWIAFILTLLWSPLMAQAEEQPVLEVELNSLAKSAPNGCRLNFLLRNALPSAIENLAFEIVLFDQDGRVSNLLRLSVGALTKGKTRVRQFDLKNTECGHISRVLINEITVCKGEDLSPRICLQALKAKSRTKVGFGL